MEDTRCTYFEPDINHVMAIFRKHFRRLMSSPWRDDIIQAGLIASSEHPGHSLAIKYAMVDEYRRIKRWMKQDQALEIEDCIIEPDHMIDSIDLNNALSVLPQLDRDIVIDVVGYGDSPFVVAQRYGISITRVTGIVARGLSILRSIYGIEEHGDEE